MTLAPSVGDVQRIVAIESPVVRNLEITYCYSQLAAACAEKTGAGANWCTYATWASRQAGRTIRGEDLLGHLELRLGKSRWLLHPIATLWRRLLRRGLFQRDTRLGRLTHELHTPFDAFERASDAVARGNLKVFEEIGLEFARYLHDGPPRDVAPPLRDAFAHYGAACSPSAIRKRHAELALLANLEIGLHEQTRLQPEILESLDSASATELDLGRRTLEALFPSASRWWPFVRRPAAATIGVFARAVQRASSRLAREVITDSFMTLALPGRVLALGTHLADAYPDVLAEPADAELKELLARFEPVAPDPDDCGARDWSDLHQRMHYIVHLFRVFHLSGNSPSRRSSRIRSRASVAASFRRESCDVVAPGPRRLIAEQPARLLDRKQRVEVAGGRSIGHRGIDLRHQLAARAVHDGVRGGDDEVLCSHIGFERKPATLRDVARVDVAPQVPPPQGRVRPERGKPFVVRRLHDVREAKRDMRRRGPAVQLTAELFREQLRKRVARLRARRVFLVDRRVRGLLPLEREPEDRFARRPDDSLQAEHSRRLEDVVGAQHVRAERRLLGADPGRGNRRQVNDGVDARQALDGFAEVGQIGK